MKVEKLKIVKIRRAGVVSRCKDSCHTRRQKGGGRGGDRKDRVVEEKGLELERGEQRITVESVLRKSVSHGWFRPDPRRASSSAERRASKSVLRTRRVEEA